jgi:hypothetical protein
LPYETIVGGAGAYLNGTLEVTPGEILSITVGVGATVGSGAADFRIGDCCSPLARGKVGIGGGHSSIARGGAVLAVAGGGGGGAYSYASRAAQWNTPACGMFAGVDACATGPGAVMASTCTSSSTCSAVGWSCTSSPADCGAGGGGYFHGGVGGPGSDVRGGAGSSYSGGLISPSGESAGKADCSSPPGTKSPYYGDSAAQGSAGGLVKGGDGRVVILPGPPAEPTQSATSSATATATTTATATSTSSSSSSASASATATATSTSSTGASVTIVVSPSASSSPVCPSPTSCPTIAPSPSPSCRPDAYADHDHCRCRRPGDMTVDACTDGMPDCPRPTCHPSVLGGGDDGGNSLAAASLDSSAANGIGGGSLAGSLVATALLSAGLGALLAVRFMPAWGAVSRRKLTKRSGPRSSNRGSAEDWDAAESGARVSDNKVDGGKSLRNPLQVY